MDIEEFLQSMNKGKKELSLVTINYILDKLNHPEKSLKCIHIAGTNGKGSCTEMMSNILFCAGYKVGKFITPHLIKYNERISVNNKYIEDKEFERIIIELMPYIKEYINGNKHILTRFELITLVAIIYFKETNCDFVVFETGLGGKTDATNVIEPLVSIITQIGYDHQRILGNTIEEIASYKAGIIKENSHTIYIKQEENSVNELIKKTCKEKNNELHIIDINNVSNYSWDNDFQKFDYKSHENILINLKGEKQIDTSCLCIEATEILKEQYNISDKALREGLSTVIHKARFETLSQNPLIIYDGAHNELAIENLRKSADNYYKEKSKVFIFSMLKRKEYKKALEKLMTNEKDIYVFTSGIKESYVAKEGLFEEAKNIGKYKEIHQKELGEAIDFVKENFKDSVIFIIGSLYTYDTVLKKLNKN